MTATNIFYNFVGFRYSPPSKMPQSFFFVFFCFFCEHCLTDLFNAMFSYMKKNKPGVESSDCYCFNSCRFDTFLVLNFLSLKKSGFFLIKRPENWTRT